MENDIVSEVRAHREGGISEAMVAKRRTPRRGVPLGRWP